MAITFYAASGSPPAWKVWLTLEHKRVPYQIEMLSFDAGDLKKPAFLAINPRGQVPVLVDGDFVLAESTAIIEYIEEKWPEPSLLPGGPRERATARRITLVAAQLGEALERLRHVDPQSADMAARVSALAKDIALLESATTGDHVAGDALSLADFSLYPVLALIRRIAARLGIAPVLDAIGPRLRAWMARIEALPCFEKTYPPHWRG